MSGVLSPRGLIGLYQSTVTLLTGGAAGLLRASERRGLIAASDWARFSGYDSGVSDDTGDIMVARYAEHVGGTYVTPTAAFYDSDDAAFDATAMWHRVPMKNWKTPTVLIYNDLGVNITVTAKVAAFGLAPIPTIFSVAAIASGTEIGLGAAGGGTGASSAWYSVPALALPCVFLYVGVTPASDPGAGRSYRVGIVRQS